MLDSQKKNAFHECGHAFLALLFEDEFDLKGVSLTPEIYSAYVNTKDWGAVAHISPKKHMLKRPTWEFTDKLILTLWGGLITQNIYINGTGSFKQNINKYILNTELLDRNGFVGDWDLINQYMPELLRVRGISYEEYKIGLMKFLFDYFFIEEVWSAINSFSQLIMSKENVSLTESEIKDHLKHIGFFKYLNRHRHSILQRRYNISFKKRMKYFLKSLF